MSEASQFVALDGESNFRDLGGYQTSSGRTVRRGLVYRSGRLSQLSDEDVDRLEQLGIRVVVSLLSSIDEQEHGQDRLPPGVRLVRLPITSAAADELVSGSVHALRSGDFSELPPSTNERIHRMLVEAGRTQYAELFELLAAPGTGPLVFHCSHGVHRTGVAAALILGTLGVPWDTIRDDYLLSNFARADVVADRLARIRAGVAAQKGIDPADVDMTNAEAFMIQRGSYIDASRDAVVAEFGDFETYALEAMHVDASTVDAMRERLIE
ncbi:MAG: tyrosine-protein phosphatase [Acidimicrobiia bacterium]